MSLLQLELDDDVIALFRETNRPEEQSARELIVLELYRRGTISSGRAAELLGMQRIDFIRHSGKLGIPYFNHDEQDIDREFETARQIASRRP